MLNSKHRSAVLFLLAALFSGTAAAQQFPHLQEESLAGAQIILPDSAAGKVAVLVLGFTHGSSKPTGEWAKRAHDDFGNRPGFVLYQLAVIEAAPRFMRGMIISGMKKGTADAQLASVVPVVHQEDALKKLVNFNASDDAYIVVLDRSGNVVYQTHGESLDPGYSQLRAKLAALLQ